MDAPDEECAEKRPEPPRIVTHWKRFACGLWRLPKGDIAAAYCADTFPRLKAFTHEGRLYMNGGNLFSDPLHTFSTCYPLILPDEYQGPESVRYSYEGKIGKFKSKEYRLGPKVIFESSDLEVEEWRQMFRVIYADGGWFLHGLTYRDYLEQLAPKSVNEYVALDLEAQDWGIDAMPETQEEMRHFLESGVIAVSSADPQLELAL